MSILEEILNLKEKENTSIIKLRLREIVQKIILIGLSKADFFKVASFYGGTALRIMYDLNRYSEDLDFSLNYYNNDFSLEPYINRIKEEALSYGIELNVEIKNKKVNSAIESAFAKLNTYQTFVTFRIDKKINERLHKDEVLKARFEIDCHPALGFNKETKWLVHPEFVPIEVLDLSSLFSGKIHAILCRNYKNNVKGRDYYDFLFFISKGVNPNMNYLRNKLIDSNKINENDFFDIEVLKKMLLEMIKKVDFEKVKEDIAKYLINNEDLSYISESLFVDAISKLKL